MNDQEINARAMELIALKRQIVQLKERQAVLKESLTPYIREHGAIKLEFGQVYYGESKGAASFCRTEVLEYLREAYGDTLADQVDQDCTKHGEPRKTLYVKLFDSVN